jgi:diguanylate cyclase (GGDEF)-like protein/PAS domain S-box-containing protein
LPKIIGMTGMPRSDAPAGRVVNPALENPALDRARLDALTNEGPLGVFEHDLYGRLIYANAAFEVISGISPGEALGFGWMRAVHADDLIELEAIHSTDSARTAEFRVLRSDGSQRWVRAHSVPVRDDGVIVGFIGTVDDITDRKRLEAQLEYDASHDRLTKLGSRALLVEQLTAALARARRTGRAVALLFIDVDGFKRVNDRLGHAAGDELLVQIAIRLRGSVREADTVARLGGDEFAVGCTDMESLDTALALGERLLDALSLPFDVHGHEVLVGASIGVATAQGEDPASVDQLLSNADVAAYRAKQRGRGRVELFDDELRRRLAQGRRVARGVARLLDAPRLPLVCTPIVQLGNGSVVGFDCAVDWAAADLDDRAAMAHVIDEAGMSRALDVALVRTVLAQLADWERRPPAGFVPGLGIVLTGVLAPTLTEIVHDMIARSNVPPELCWIGLPESAVGRDLALASEVVQSLAALGVGVALRDFGAEIGSLEQLRCIPSPVLALAGALTTELDLGRAVVAYARALGRVVTAAGVVDAEQAGHLREIGVEFGSGPAFGPPIRPDQVESFLVRRSV